MHLDRHLQSPARSNASGNASVSRAASIEPPAGGYLGLPALTARVVEWPATPQSRPHAGVALTTQVYWNYTTSLPIPTTRTPTFTTVAPNISYPSLTAGGIMTLAGGAQTNFALRFVGTRAHG